MFDQFNSSDISGLLPWVLLAIGFWGFFIAASFKRAPTSSDRPQIAHGPRPKARG